MFFLALFMPMSCFASDLILPSLNYDDIRTSSHRYNDPIQDFEAWYIQEMLTKPLLKSDAMGEDNNEEEAMVDTSFEKEYINDVLAKKLAENLAKKGFLNLKKQKIFQQAYAEKN